MDKNILKQVIVFVDQSFKAKLDHFDRTLYWLLELKPDADLAMKIAAYAHDIQRAFAEKESLKLIENSENGFKDEALLKDHMEAGGQMMHDFLIQRGQNKELAERVRYLISKHEVGGDDDQNTLKDADSLSYFETNAEHFITKYAPILGVDKVKAKFDWMFERISGTKAKEIALPMYHKATNLLLNQSD